MTFARTILATTAILALAGCPGEEWGDDTADSADFYDGPVQIHTLDFACDPGSPDAWTFYALADGYAGGMTLDIFETGDGNWPSNPSAVWDESHDLQNIAWADDGSWDEWEIRISEVDTPSAQVSGQTTLFDCAWNDGRSLAFMMTMYAETGSQVDCAIWGHESQQYFNGNRGESCVCFDNDGSCTN